MYETIKKSLISYLNKDRTNFGISFISGAFSGSLAATLTIPFDVVKTQQQITLGRMSINAGSTNNVVLKNQSTIGSMKEIIRRSGYKGLFAGILSTWKPQDGVFERGPIFSNRLSSGLTPRVARVTPSCAIMIGSYEYMKQFLSKSPADSLKTRWSNIYLLFLVIFSCWLIGYYKFLITC